jgi:hypothetical protein
MIRKRPRPFSRFKKIEPRRQAYKGQFRPLNPQKYIGDINKIVFRSSWELAFMKYCDKEKTIVKWGSEEIRIPYNAFGINKLYYPDFIIVKQLPNKSFEKYLIEIKPHTQTRKPVLKEGSRTTSTYKKALYTYEVNRCKWNAAFAWCKKRNIIFKIITEKHVNFF